MILQLRRWLPQRPLVLVGDGGYAVLDLLHANRWLNPTLIARLRLDAALYESAGPERSAPAEPTIPVSPGPPPR